MEDYKSIIVVLLLLIIIVVILIFKSPYKYPYFNCYFDVSGKRQPQIKDYIDIFLNENNYNQIVKHDLKIKCWKQDCANQIKNSPIKSIRQKQYRKCLDDENAFRFYFTRQQTRYKQQNYVKTSYKVTQTVDGFFCSYKYLTERNEELESINHSCTLSAYHSKNQRKLMTTKLRKQIMERDNYTCQQCGKYMPDEIGLQVDHIVPVSKGGKSIPSNLQVLCSKCNGAKSNK